MRKGIGERIRKVRGSLSRDEFAKRLDSHRNTIMRYEKGEREPDAIFLLRICTEFNINPEWLLFGEGPMYRHERAERPPESPVASVDEACLDPSHYVFVPLAEGRVTAGPDGGFLYEPVDYYPFKRHWIEAKFGRRPERWKALVLVRVSGDSMEPTINAGEIVLVDTYEAERVEIRSGKIYMVRMPDGAITLKRLILRFDREKEIYKLVCLSDNPHYEPFEFEILPDRKIQYYVLGRIRWVGREID